MIYVFLFNFLSFLCFFLNDFVMIVFMIFLMICLGENINVYEFLCFFCF